MNNRAFRFHDNRFSRHVDVQPLVELYLKPVRNSSFAILLLNMVLCSIVGCSNRSGRDKASYRRLPAIIYHQGEQMLAISTERRRTWLAAISRADLIEDRLHNVYVCSRRFVEG